MSKSFTVLDVATVNTNIATLRASGTAMSELAHATLVSILAHVRDHGDTSLAVRFVNALPSMARKEAVKLYVYKFSGKQLSLKLKDGVWDASLVPQRDPALFDIEGAAAVNFGDYSPEPKVRTEPMTLADVVKALTKFTNNQKTLANGAPQVPAEVCRAAQKALSAISA